MVIPERLVDKIIVDPVSDCWVWVGAKNLGGYGVVNTGVHAKTDLVHRFTYKLLVGPLEPGQPLDHLCFIRACCNPAHTEPVTAAENTRRSTARITACPVGHPYTEANVYLQRGKWRKCKACNREKQALRRRASEVTV